MNTYRNVVLGVLAVAAIAVIGLLATLTFYVVSDYRAQAEAAAKAEKSKVDKSALAAQVTDGLQGMLDNNEETRRYYIQLGSDLTLFQLVEGGSEYRGLVTAKTQRGTEVPVMVTVYADGSGALIYQMDPASNLRLTQIASEECGATLSASATC
jgi:type II secretory pathway pseudopilin PulG